jgi:hypothetical protein
VPASIDVDSEDLREQVDRMLESVRGVLDMVMYNTN